VLINFSRDCGKDFALRHLQSSFCGSVGGLRWEWVQGLGIQDSGLSIQDPGLGLRSRLILMLTLRQLSVTDTLRKTSNHRPHL